MAATRERYGSMSHNATSTGRVDFHLHSYASNVTDYYASNAFAIPESYSDPLENSMRLLKSARHGIWSP